MSESPLELEHKTPFEFTSVLLQGIEGLGNIELKNVVTDIDVFEHLDKPYLTAVMSFTDTADIFSSGLLQGHENVSVGLKHAHEDAVEIKKDFTITKVLSATKINDNSEGIILHLIEKHAFASNYTNVNLPYRGAPASIIEKIAKTIDKEIESSGKGYQEMKVIVPNLTPIEAMAWIKNRSTTKEGYPFYLYSSLVGDKLHFSDLKSLIKQAPINPDYPFSHVEGNIPVETEEEVVIKRRTILNYQHRMTDSLFEMISDGLLASKLNYIDVTQGKQFTGKFDIDKDVVSKLTSDNLSANKFGELDYFKTTGLNTKTSSTKARIGSSMAFDGVKSYTQGNDFADYKLDVINAAMDNVLKKSPLTMTVNFAEFMNGEENKSVGKKISVRFLKNLPYQNEDGEEIEDKFDPKKSGDFLIFATKHSFRRENYSATHSCVKLSDEQVMDKG